MTNLSTQSFKKDFENQYKKIGKVHNPFFGCDINFNSLGLHHLYNNGQQNQRNKDELELRCKLALLVPKFLKENITPSTFTLREYTNKENFWEKTWSFIVRYENRNWQERNYKDDYYVKFLIRECSDKEKHFYSVMLIKKDKKSPEGEIK